MEMEENAITDTAVRQKFAENLHADLKQAIDDKKPAEQRMLEALRQFHGLSGEMKQAKGSEGGLVSGGKIQYPSQDNITRPLTLKTAARWADMMLPTNDRNWQIDPTPVPELHDPKQPAIAPNGAPMVSPDGQPLTLEDIRQAQVKEAKKKAAGMQEAIDDDLQECHFAAEARDGIFDASLYGCGILKGPFVFSKPKKCRKKSEYTDKNTGQKKTLYEIELIQEKKAVVSRVDPWNFFPQRSRCIEEAEKTFELHLYTEKQTRALAKQPGFDPEAVNELLGKGCGESELSSAMLTDRSSVVGYSSDAFKGRFTVWEYHGPIPKEVLTAMGMEIPEDDKLTVLNGEVWFSNGVVLKAALSHLEGEERLPYYVINYEKDPTDIFGYGVPWVIRHDQNAVHTLWDLAMVNGVASAGVTLAMLAGRLQGPSGGVVTEVEIGVKPINLLHFSDEQDSDVRKVVQQFSIESRLNEIMPLYEKAKENANEHAMMPEVLEGEGEKAYGTLVGTIDRIRNKNIIQRRFALETDDNWLAPIIEAMYDWHMLHNEDDSIKGDYSIVPRGVSHLLVKELRSANIMTVVQLSADPRFAPFFENYDLAELSVSQLDLPPNAVLKPKDKAMKDAEAMSQPPPDPRIEAEKIRQQTQAASDQAMLAKVQLEGQVQLQLSRERTVQEQIKAAAQSQDRADDRAANDRATSMEAENERLRMALDAEHKNRKLDQDARKNAADTTLKATEIASKQQHDQTEAALERPYRTN